MNMNDMYSSTINASGSATGPKTSIGPIISKKRGDKKSERFKSDVWLHFEKHLRACTKYPGNVDKRQKLLSSIYKPKCGDSFSDNTLGAWKFDQELCRQMLTRMVIVDEQHFAMVEREGFKDFVSTLQPLYKHVSRVTVARHCMKLYASEKVNLKRLLTSMKNIWTMLRAMNKILLLSGIIEVGRHEKY